MNGPYTGTISLTSGTAYSFQANYFQVLTYPVCIISETAVRCQPFAAAGSCAVVGRSQASGHLSQRTGSRRLGGCMPAVTKSTL